MKEKKLNSDSQCQKMIYNDSLYSCHKLKDRQMVACMLVYLVSLKIVRLINIGGIVDYHCLIFL
jgi:hypothetical protein